VSVHRGGTRWWAGAAALWLLGAGAAWHVAFDRHVANAGLAFTREQVLRAQQGRPVLSIDESFRPAVRRAALAALPWAGLIAAAGAVFLLTVARSERRVRSRDARRSSRAT
jgi:hypothetical protein